MAEEEIKESKPEEQGEKEEPKENTHTILKDSEGKPYMVYVKPKVIEEEKNKPEEQKEENKENILEESEKEIATNAIINRQKRQEGFLKSLEGGVSILKASKEAGIDYKTIWRWRRDDEEFNNKVMAILDSRIMIVEDALFLNAAKGNLGAQIFYLKNRSQGRWKDKTEEDVTLNVKGGLDFNEYRNMKEMKPDERKQYIEKLFKICGSGNSKTTDADQGKDK